MKPRDIEAEMEAAVNAVEQGHIDRLRALGVTAETIARLGAFQPPFGVMGIDIIGGGMYQPGGPQNAVIQPVIEDGYMIDLIAWQSSNPARWYWRYGAGWALNTDEIRNNSWTDDPLLIEATPLNWLRSGGRGLCILDWDAPEVRDLMRVKSILADRSVATQLRNTLLKPLYFPDIRIREALRNAA